VVVIASTNRPFDLDEAVLRRLPRRILVDLPDVITREEILRVTLSNNRIAKDVNFTSLAISLEGYTGSDIKEICREAVVRVAHERAMQFEVDFTSLQHANLTIPSSPSSSIDANHTQGNQGTTTSLLLSEIWTEPLRAVTLKDFQLAMKRLKASVDDSGREMQKVTEWNEKYGEFKKKGNGNNASSGKAFQDAKKLNLYI
jgi:SpoVK/Ycf46/Vps4 family AAA+-type ATPase